MYAPFIASDFTATKHSSAADKAKFANHFVRFVASGYKWTLFHKWFYTRLSMTFGHIAHYNRAGFYCTWFDSLDGRVAFMQRLHEWSRCGSPEYTYSDVEAALQRYYQTN